MKQYGAIRVVVAESSAILRAGVSTTLRHLPELHVQTIEVSSPELLHRCLQGHRPELLVVNPSFGGWFDLEAFRNHPLSEGIKCIALPVAVSDTTVLKPYDAVISLYDEPETIKQAIVGILFLEREEERGEELSTREKEVIVQVVKGLTNKEIADKLFLSIHTVLTHRRNIARKLEIHSPAGLTIYAIVNKLVELSEVKMR
jgi:DNA-binding NarL/FixJ family response regulator